MNGRTWHHNVPSVIARWAKLVPGLLRHDPLFRYAAIAAVFAMFFLAARLAQDIAGPGAIPPAESNRTERNASQPIDKASSDAEPPAPGSSTTPSAPDDAAPPSIAPGRPLEGLEVEPAPRDNFGTLPKGENPG